MGVPAATRSREDFGTTPSLARTLAGQAAERDIAFLDAPVSGGQRGARDGTLSVIVGGEPAVFERVRSLFDDIGANVYHMGEAGSGQTAKLVNNMMAFTSMWSLVEGLALGTKDLQLALDLADELGVEAPMARTSGELLDRFIGLGFDAEEIYATIRYHEEALAVAIRGR